MGNLETKIRLRTLIKQRCEEDGSYYREVDPIRILIRCPFCGDSSDPRHAHFYIICDTSQNTNAGYICFKCGEHGAVTAETLTALGISDPNIKSELVTLNKTAEKSPVKGYMEENRMDVFPMKTPPRILPGRKIQYLEKRLGRTFSEEELKDMKVIPSIHKFLDLNGITDYAFSKYQMNMLEHDYVGFLSYGNSHLLLRDITGNHKDYSWIKYPILEESRNNRVFYTISTELDPFTTEPITVNMAEGIMDILSICYNLGYGTKNTLNVCISGNHYERFLIMLLDLGIVGSNVTINVFPDNDIEFNPTAKKKTTISYFEKIFQKFKYLYKEINVFYNKIGKDCGVPKDEIKLKKYRL